MVDQSADLAKQVENVVEGGLDVLQALSRQSVDDRLSRYLLKLDHPVGGNKAKCFRDAVGFAQ